MGGKLQVETQELDRLLRQLATGREDMEKALDALERVGPKSTGSVALDHACDEFHDSWDDAIKKIAKGTQQIEEKLKATKNNYEETERAIRDAMSKGAAPPMPAPSAPPNVGAYPAGPRPSAPAPAPSSGPGAGAR
ncbi:WXG100 family type VII secretion target [Streptomyces sp. NPDC059788]|uniref:WXG100 family type VII secretion target n=1 Tax=Streptomyces sp. NPDC059788 TaxID=3346948 RepID=UPI0036657496